MKRVWGAVAGLKMEGPYGEEDRWLIGPESDPQLMSRRKQEPQSHNRKILNPANNKDELGRRFSSRASGQESSPANTLISGLSYPEQRTQSGHAEHGSTEL